jgi:hypothetical protein
LGRFNSEFLVSTLNILV